MLKVNNYYVSFNRELYNKTCPKRPLKKRQNKGLNAVFFSAVFGAVPLAKKYVFSPILKENSPQNEVFKKKKSAKCDDSVSEVRINLFRALAMP